MDHLILIFSFWILTFIFWMIIIPYFIRFLITFKLWKQIRDEAFIWKAEIFSKLHSKKKWTPTMWWAIILAIVFFMVIVSIIMQKFDIINNSLLNQKETYLSLFTLLTVWFLWLVDDFMNIKEIWRTKWLSWKFKMFWLTIFWLIWSYWFYEKLEWSEKLLNIPFIEPINIWLLIVPVFVLIIVAWANSVNVTDWLDGLAWWLLLFSYSVYAFITYSQGLFLLSTLCVTIIWALIAFLWFNVKPAKFYMWDIWSLSLWANLWIMAMLTNTVFVLAIISSIFIFEAISVIIQVVSKKVFKKKVFKIAPFHHHLEAIWWPEETVVFRLWLVWLLSSVLWIIIYLI